jgi:hypothetical protein
MLQSIIPHAETLSNFISNRKMYNTIPGRIINTPQNQKQAVSANDHDSIHKPRELAK